MSVGLLIITHDSIGTAMLETASGILGHCPLAARALAITPQADPDRSRDRADLLRRELDQGDGVLVLTDLFGSTPANIAMSLMHPGRVSVAAGLNLPMLVRILNYAHLNLDALTEKAVYGGRDGVFLCE